MSELWIESSEKILAQIKKLEESKGADRLELVRLMQYLLTALHRSLMGWIQWVNNPSIMTTFTQDELEKMTKNLSDFVRAFIEYDLEATKLGVDKGLQARRAVEGEREEREERAGEFYV